MGQVWQLGWSLEGAKSQYRVLQHTAYMVESRVTERLGLVQRLGMKSLARVGEGRSGGSSWDAGAMGCLTRHGLSPSSKATCHLVRSSTSQLPAPGSVGMEPSFIDSAVNGLSHTPLDFQSGERAG